MGTTWGSVDTDQFKTVEIPTQDSSFFLICRWGKRVAFGGRCSLTSPSCLTSLLVLDEALKDEDEMEVVLRVAQRQHGDAAHAWILVLRRQGGTEGLCGSEADRRSCIIANVGFM